MEAAPTGRGSDVSWAAVALAVARRPRLWAPAVRLGVRLAPSGWWRRRPWLPVPDRAYLRFRMVTAFGPDPVPPPSTELVSYLRWLRAWPRVVER